jgi:hypothetical protein
MSIGEQDLLEELAYSESEGPADMEGDDLDMFSADAGEADFGDYAEGDAADFEDYGDAGDYGAKAEADEFIGQLLGSILGAEDEDEFFGKLLSGAKNLIKKAAPIVGKIARGAGPILSMIPHPAAQIGGQVANVLGKLRAEGASVEDALEAVAEIAVRDRRALPIVAGLAARSVVRNRGAAMPPAQRQQIAKTMNRAAKALVATGGPKAIRALPKITRSVRRTTAANGTPAAVRPKVVARTAGKVARNPSLMRKLSAPSPRAQRLVQGAVNGVRYGNGGGGGGSTRTINVPGPATITISVG